MPDADFNNEIFYLHVAATQKFC